VNEPLTVGVLGTGTMASEVHLPALLASADARVVWVSDRDAARARRVAKAHGVRAVDLTGDLLALPRADVVLLGIPYGARAPYYPVLAEMGAAVYVEKPFARSLAEHDAQAAPFAAERVAVGYQKRSAAFAKALREVVASGLFGELTGMRVEYGRPGVATGGRYSTNLALAGGGILFEVGVHVLDLALFVADAASVEGTTGRMERELGFDVHTEATTTVRTNRGGSVHLEVLVTNLWHTTGELLLRFERAEVRVDPFGEGIVHVRPRGSSIALTLGGEAAVFPNTSGQMVWAHWGAFLRGIREGKPNATNASATRVTTALVEGLYSLAEK
jgi:predicted dehydrogenase